MPVPPYHTALRVITEYLFRSYRIGGSHSGGGETPMSVHIFLIISLVRFLSFLGQKPGAELLFIIP